MLHESHRPAAVQISPHPRGIVTEDEETRVVHSLRNPAHRRLVVLRRADTMEGVGRWVADIISTAHMGSDCVRAPDLLCERCSVDAGRMRKRELFQQEVPYRSEVSLA